jgi:hypothetical protein
MGTMGDALAAELARDMHHTGAHAKPHVADADRRARLMQLADELNNARLRALVEELFR